MLCTLLRWPQRLRNKVFDMSDTLMTNDTEAVLLLCGRFGGERENPFNPLSTREYGELAKWLNLRGIRPSDLLTDVGRLELKSVHEAKLEQRRVEFLLGRGTAMALALERWSRGGLWVMSRGDVEFPKRLKRLFKHAAPPLLYGAGKKELLDLGGLAMIGSRDATESALEFTREVAAKCANEDIGVVSGGARGVDVAAMQGATDAGGFTIGVLASDLLKTSVNRQNRLGLQEGRLVLVSPFFPEAGFNAGNAMGRNKFIYALSDRALVIDSALGSGGTWEGAVEALNQKWVPVYVRTPGNGPGNAALVEKGGIPFTFASSQGERLHDYFEHTAQNMSMLAETLHVQHSLLDVDEKVNIRAIPSSDVTSPNVDVVESIPPSALEVQEVNATKPSGYLNLATESQPDAVEMPVSTDSPCDLLDMYLDFLSKLDLILKSGPLAEDQVSERLCLEKSQAKAWLKKLLIQVVSKS